MNSDVVLLAIHDLSVAFHTGQGMIKPVERVSFDVRAGKTTALVGQSGCGKTLTALSVMRLIPAPYGKIIGGRILFKGLELLRLGRERMRGICGNEIAMVFQEPATSLNPVLTVGMQIAEAIMLHKGIKKPQAITEAVRMLESVGIAEPRRRAAEYPHQMSGGMRQRVMLAMALSCRPALLIADEPTTALDVTIQAQILELLRRFQLQTGMGIMLITHDLGLVAQNADDVVVMYAAKVVERAAVWQLFEKPLHPYTAALLRLLPGIGSKYKQPMACGTVPGPYNYPCGCRFCPGCPKGQKDSRCRSLDPPLLKVRSGRAVACWYAEGFEKGFESGAIQDE